MTGAVQTELVPVPIKDEEGRETGALLEADEGIRRGGTMESLGALPSAASWDHARGTRRMWRRGP